MVDRVYQRNTSDSAPQPPADPSNGYPTGGNPAQGVPATIPGPYWYHMITESLRRVVVEAGLTPDHEDLDQVVEALQAMGLGTAQFQNYSSLRTYETGEVTRGSDGHFYEFYDRDQEGAVQDVDPTDPMNRPHIWMEWDGVRPATVIEWRSETIPEGYVKIIGDDISRTDYRRIWGAWGTKYGAGDGIATFGTPDDRGESKRGWDDGRGVDAGRELAEPQAGSIVSMGDTSNTAPAVWSFHNNIDDSPNTLRAALNGEPSTLVASAANIAVANATIAASSSSTNSMSVRVRNNAVIYLAKI